MKKNSNFWDSLSEFVSGKGFYLVVLLCVAVIGMSGYFLARAYMGTQTDPLAETVAGATQMPDAAVATPGPTLRPVKPSKSPTPTAQPAPSPALAPSATPAPTVSPATATPAPNPASRVFTWPVNGPVIASFSVETLLYDETMLDWRTHDGIDLAAETGTRVLATAAGTVSQVYCDALMGTTIVIDHGRGLTSLYANLGEDVQVAEGDEVFTGDIIGAVGATAPAESGRDPHLHFAMYQDETAVNPEEYLPD